MDVELKLLVIKTHDIVRLYKFYRLIGLKFNKEQHGSGPEHYATLLGNTVFEIYPCREGQSPDECRLGFSVDSLHEVLERISSSGSEVLSVPKESFGKMMALIQDPDGRKIELYESRNELI